jgi:hypothetical protein
MATLAAQNKMLLSSSKVKRRLRTEPAMEASVTFRTVKGSTRSSQRGGVLRTIWLRSQCTVADLPVDHHTPRQTNGILEKLHKLLHHFLIYCAPPKRPGTTPNPATK